MEGVKGLKPDVIRTNTPVARKDNQPGKAGDFARVLDQSLQNPELKEKGQQQALKFSNHAVERMQRRGVNFSPEEIGKIQNAVDEAGKKGAKETLVLSDKSAMIVSVKNNTVVTVMDKANLKNNVFTNIDSTVVV